MTDLAFSNLAAVINEHSDKSSLWIVDENTRHVHRLPRRIQDKFRVDGKNRNYNTASSVISPFLYDF